MTVRIIIGDARDRLKELPAESVNCVVTSPPYWSLRDYGVVASVWGGEDDCYHQWGDLIVANATNHTDKRRWNHARNGRDEEQPVEKRVSWLRTPVPQGKFCQACGAWSGAHGLEPTPDLFVSHAVMVFREIYRILRHDGTLWLNLGDCYSSGGRGGNPTAASSTLQGSLASQEASISSRRKSETGLKPKNLVGIPWRVAFALQADGWFLRQDIIWSKPNPMPESVEDRCTRSHEYLFLLSKSERYHFDQESILEPVSPNTHARLSQDIHAQLGSVRAHAGGKTNGNMKAVGRKSALAGTGIKNNDSMNAAMAIMPDRRNRRSVWTINTEGFSEAHFATFPPALIEPCILAGCPRGGVVLDPFGGAGTTGLVADRLQRDSILIELNPEYAAMAARRIRGEGGMLSTVEVEQPLGVGDRTERNRERDVSVN